MSMGHGWLSSVKIYETPPGIIQGVSSCHECRPDGSEVPRWIELSKHGSQSSDVRACHGGSCGFSVLYIIIDYVSVGCGNDSCGNHISIGLKLIALFRHVRYDHSYATSQFYSISLINNGTPIISVPLVQPPPPSISLPQSSAASTHQLPENQLDGLPQGPQSTSPQLSPSNSPPNLSHQPSVPTEFQPTSSGISVSSQPQRIDQPKRHRKLNPKYYGDAFVNITTAYSIPPAIEPPTVAHALKQPLWRKAMEATCEPCPVISLADNGSPTIGFPVRAS
nr:vegetative cell wall protein gp1-like [Ipomoea batatas]